MLYGSDVMKIAYLIYNVFMGKKASRLRTKSIEFLKVVFYMNVQNNINQLS